MKRKMLLTISLFVIIGMILAACQPATTAPTTAAATTAATKPAATSATAAATPKTGGILKIGTGQNPTVLGYTPKITPNAMIQYLRVVFDTLCFYDEKGNLAPMLATKWAVDPAAKTITFTLRDDVKFSDGTDFNAEAVKWNIEQYQAAKRTETSNIASITVVDKTTITLNLLAWNSSTLESVGFFVYYMSPTAVQKNGVDWAEKNPVGTGPFVLKEWKQGVSVKYEKNPTYWQKGKPYLNGVEFYIIADAMTLSSSLQAGEIDLISYASLLLTRDLTAAGFIRETNSNGVGVEGLGIIPSSKNEKSPFYDARVRQALCYAIDNDSIIKTLGYGLVTKTNQWAAPGAKTYNPDVVGYNYDPAKAKALLKEAGFADGFDTVFYTYAGDEMGPVVSKMLTDVGIRAKLELVDAAKYSALYMGEWEGVLYHFNSIGPDLGLFMGRHLDVNGAYYAKSIQHPQDTLDLLEKIRTATDETTKLKLSFDLQKLIYDKYALFGKPLYVQSINTIKYKYVMDDQWAKYHVAAWKPADTWLDK